MKFKSLVALILTVCLAVITSNAMARSDKSGKSDKSAKHSEKSDKNAKSRKSGRSGKGHGHCKSDKSGKGHNRDCDDDNPPVLVCVAVAGDVIEFAVEEERFDSRCGSLGFFTTSISYTGPICARGDADAYQGDVSADGGTTICEYSPSSSSVSNRQENETEFWHDMTTVLECRDFISS